EGARRLRVRLGTGRRAGPARGGGLDVGGRLVVAGPVDRGRGQTGRARVRRPVGRPGGAALVASHGRGHGGLRRRAGEIVPCRFTLLNRRHVAFSKMQSAGREMQKPRESRGLLATFCVRTPMIYPVELQGASRPGRAYSTRTAPPGKAAAKGSRVGLR